MKLLKKAQICLVGLLSIGMAGCPKGKGTPIYEECILTVAVDSNNQITDAVADCQNNDGKQYERRSSELDGMYMYTAEGRANIIRWGKSACRK